MSFKHDFQISLSKSANGRNQSLEIFGLKIIREKNYILRKYVNKLFIFWWKMGSHAQGHVEREVFSPN